MKATHKTNKKSFGGISKNKTPPENYEKQKNKRTKTSRAIRKIKKNIKITLPRVSLETFKSFHCLLGITGEDMSIKL